MSLPTSWMDSAAAIDAELYCAWRKSGCNGMTAGQNTAGAIRSVNSMWAVTVQALFAVVQYKQRVVVRKLLLYNNLQANWPAQPKALP